MFRVRMNRLLRSLRRTYSLEAELAIVAGVLLAWHAARIPLEGDVATSLAHAGDVVDLEQSLGIHVEPAFVDEFRGTDAETVLGWLYLNLHLPVLFGFFAATRLLAPARYPVIRTTFALSFVPAVLVIGLYPLAPPKWLPEFGLGPTPSDAELTATTGALFHNTTAAAASQHFGFAVFVAVACIWLCRGAPLAWLTLAYPALVFVVIVGTGNHYVVDGVVGMLTFVLAALVAVRVHGHAAPRPSFRTGAASIALGYAVITWGAVSIDVTQPRSVHNLVYALVVIAGIAAVVAPRVRVESTPVPEG
jgi:hypothetical protein